MYDAIEVLQYEEWRCIMILHHCHNRSIMMIMLMMCYSKEEGGRSVGDVAVILAGFGLAEMKFY